MAEQTTPTLDLHRFTTRLTEIDMAVRFSLSAIDAQRDKTEPVLDNMATALRAELANFPEDELDKEIFLKSAIGQFRYEVPSRVLLLNLSLVMLCTELEMFVTHLVDTILASDPRRLLQFAGEKHVSTRELIDAGDYDGVLSSLRDKVTDEITNSNVEDMFMSHLGKRFKLISKDELCPARICQRQSPIYPLGVAEWNLQELKKVFSDRHDIVHRALSPVQDVEYIAKASQYFSYLEMVLCLNARKVYSVPMQLMEWALLISIAKAWGLETDYTNRENVVPISIDKEVSVDASQELAPDVARKD